MPETDEQPEGVPPWPARLTNLIGQQVRRYRNARGISVQQLSDAVERFGVTIQRPVLSNLETGRRGTVSVAEVIVLAAALRVPPLLLIFPLGAVDEVEVLNGISATPWQALAWGLGDKSLPDHPELSDETERKIFALWQEHEGHIRLWRQSVEASRDLRADAAQAPTAEERDALIGSARDAELFLGGATASLRRARMSMREAGLRPPDLPPELRGADDGVPW